jgi:hypothetical protein
MRIAHLAIAAASALSLSAADQSGSPRPFETEGVSALVENLMGLAPGEHAQVPPAPTGPRIGFFLAQAYDPKLAVPADTVQLYVGASQLVLPDGAGSRPDWPAIFKSWTRKGYFTQVFLHSRYGSLIDEDAPNVQTDRHGHQLTVFEVYDASAPAGSAAIDLGVGPMSDDLAAVMERKHGKRVVIRRADRYEIPTRARIELAQRFYEDLLTEDVAGFCFDEPEIWANAGYSPAFKEEWRAHFGTAWQPPHESVDARYRAEQLKAILVRRWVESILNDVKRRRPSIPLMLAMHSQPGYVGIGMGAPHHRLIAIPVLDEIVAEVWNEPFDASYLQYSSFCHQVRGTGKQLWMMMDPWGDSPALSPDYYRHRYGDNVVSALLFPTADHFQPQIWPNRLYGKIPKDYEIVINTVAGALGEIRHYSDGRIEAGSRGFGTFVSDSMSWQRAEPFPSDFDGFYGISAPLVQRGLPVDVFSLDRAAEPGYLAGAKCLFLSYDFLKPTEAAQNRALAEWTRQGGALVCFGGTDAYNGVADSWWVRAGHASPLEELFAHFGIPMAKPRVLATPGNRAVLEPDSAMRAAGATPVTVTLGPTPGEEQFRQRVNLWQIEQDTPTLNPTYPVTLYEPPAGATVCYRLRGDGSAVVWEASAGKGSVLFVGISPGFFKTSASGPAMLAALAQHAFSRTGADYREGACFLMRRGPYAAVHTLQHPYTLPGRFVDLFSPDLAVSENPTIPPQTNAFFAALDQAPGIPRAPHVSGRLRASYDSASLTSFVVQAPSGTDGVARVFAGSRHPTAIKAFTTSGAPVAITSQDGGDTLLLRYPSDADGIVVRIKWSTG